MYFFLICFIKIITFFNIISYTCEISYSQELTYSCPREQTNKKRYFTIPLRTLTLKSTGHVRSVLKKFITFSEKIFIWVTSTPTHVKDRHSVINYQT